MNKELFNSPTKGSLNTEQVIEEIAEFVSQDSASFYRLVIGTDSQAKQVDGKPQIDFVTALVVHRQGHGARYFWKKEKLSGKLVLRDKIYKETLMSVEIAQRIVPQLREAITAVKYDFEIHIDVGAIGPTREMIKEVVGMVNGNGYVAKTKPDSWGASKVADKHT
jgi:predicted RNase H-related nuclease YkuK (DUF458 family)